MPPGYGDYPGVPVGRRNGRSERLDESSQLLYARARGVGSGGILGVMQGHGVWVAEGY